MTFRRHDIENSGEILNAQFVRTINRGRVQTAFVDWVEGVGGVERVEGVAIRTAYCHTPSGQKVRGLDSNIEASLSKTYFSRNL